MVLSRAKVEAAELMAVGPQLMTQPTSLFLASFRGWGIMRRTAR